jgi:uncharacterized membrane-anchored protein YjiN (DUF445 family)
MFGQHCSVRKVGAMSSTKPAVQSGGSPPTGANGLRRMKRFALALLLLAGAIFVACRVIARTNDATWIGYVEATAEAAMVGALADWFAVTALFRRPLGLPIPHTAIIKTRKNEIGASLGDFVQQNFLQPDALAERILRARPSAQVVEWLERPGSADRVASGLLQAASGIAEVLDADEVTVHLQHALVDAVRSVDIAPFAAQVIEVGMADGRKDQLLDGGLGAVIRALDANRSTLRLGFAQRSPWWVPGSVDERVFDKLYSGILDLLGEVRRDPTHELRRSIDSQLVVFVESLRTDPAMKARCEALLDEALEHHSVNRFVASSWDALRVALRHSTEPGASVSRDRMCVIVERGTNTLRSDAVLRDKLDVWSAAAVRSLVGEYGHLASGLISSTIEGWDPDETAGRIEEQIGRDLQFIRINGTMVGGLVGLGVHTIGQLVG